MSRRWLQVRVRARADADLSSMSVDGLVEGLLALGGRAAEERDGWYMTAIEEPSDLDAFVARARSTLAELTGSDAIDLEVEWRNHEDWAETWKRGLAPRWVTPRILVRPSWTSPPAEIPAVEIVLDPGMAFGTAEHGTTRGCLRLLDGVVQTGDRVLDVGSGSGILAIAAVLLGAAEVIAVEADTGKVLHAENATVPWYPASVTKLMTSYVTLQAVKSGRLTLDTLLTVSSRAAAQQPSKMGFKAGTRVTVDNALKMLMVKSANDIAVVLAEGVGGSVEKFADEMNGVSRKLGMTGRRVATESGFARPRPW